MSTHFIRMRGPEFPLHLPHQIRKFAARRNPFKERQIALIDMLPIHTGHILRPEIFTLQPPRFPIHLTPLGCRNDGGSDPIQINPTGLSVRTPSTPGFGIAFSLFPRLDNAQPISSRIDKRFRITRKLKIINTGNQCLLFLVLEIVGMEDTPRSAILIARGCILHRKRRKKCLAFNTSDLPITSVRIRECDNALCNTFHIYCDQLLGLLLRLLIRCLLLVIVCLVSFILIFLLLLKWTGFRDERIAQGVLQGYQQRTHRHREPKIKVERIVDRIELTIGEKIEIFSFRIPRWTEIVEFWIRDEPRFPGFNLAEFD